MDWSIVAGIRIDIGPRIGIRIVAVTIGTGTGSEGTGMACIRDGTVAWDGNNAQCYRVVNTISYQTKKRRSENVDWK